jgi:hypothetical protein
MRNQIVASQTHQNHQVFGGLQLILDPNSELAKAMEPFESIFATFHPGKCPVTWRILVAQYFILRAMRLSQREKVERGEQDDTLARIVLNEATVNELAWRQPADEEVTAPLHIGLKYLASALHQRPLTTVPITRWVEDSVYRAEPAEPH